MLIKIYAEPCETVPGRWQVVGSRDGSDNTFLLEAGLTKQAAVKSVRLAERAALLAGASVIA